MRQAGFEPTTFGSGGGNGRRSLTLAVVVSGTYAGGAIASACQRRPRLLPPLLPRVGSPLVLEARPPVRASGGSLLDPSSPGSYEVLNRRGRRHWRLESSASANRTAKRADPCRGSIVRGQVPGRRTVARGDTFTVIRSRGSERRGCAASPPGEDGSLRCGSSTAIERDLP